MFKSSEHSGIRASGLAFDLAFLVSAGSVFAEGRDSTNQINGSVDIAHVETGTNGTGSENGDIEQLGLAPGQTPVAVKVRNLIERDDDPERALRVLKDALDVNPKAYAGVAEEAQNLLASNGYQEPASWLASYVEDLGVHASGFHPNADLEQDGPAGVRTVTPVHTAWTLG